MLPINEVLFTLFLTMGSSLRLDWKESLDLSLRNLATKTTSQFPSLAALVNFSQLFTKIVDSNNILEENQAGFKKGYSTSDHLFALNALIELLKTRKKNLFCCFVVFTKAFDSVWRVGHWQKLLKSNVDGKMFRIVRNMYSNIKLCHCVRIGTTETPFFTSGCGVRQGKNSSPLLFSLFLNDLDNFLFMNRCDGIGIQYSDYDIFLYFAHSSPCR